MMDRRVSVAIARDRCDGCGRCLAVCPSETLSLQDGKAVVAGDRSLACGHCAAACPRDAIRIDALDPAASTYATFAADERWLPRGEGEIASLVRLMASRRSCRNFQEQPVARPLLEDLVKIGVTAPSGTNSQHWSFTILPTRDAVAALGNRVAAFFRKVNALADNPLLRNALRLLGKPELHDYYRDYRATVGEALDEQERRGRDRLFHGAPAAIVVGSRPGGSTSPEDALLATQNILLAAHVMGLGTCLIGFAAISLMRDIRTKRFVGIPDEETVHAVIALGYAHERYVRIAGRKPFVHRWFEAGSGGSAPRAAGAKTEPCRG